MSARYSCRDERRRAEVRKLAGGSNPPHLNGIDYVEVTSPVTLEVHFIHAIDAGAPLSELNVRIDGGVRVKAIKAVTAITNNEVLTITVSQSGDFSIYTLRLVTSATDDDAPDGYDPRLAAVELSFKVDCPSPFDCKPDCTGKSASLPEPRIDYLAKDYATFRQLMLDRMALLVPQWRERNPADIGITLVELLAYAADQLSYQQDVIATEAYLGTARRRVSVRRHARLVDYPMHDGCNARAWVQLEVKGDILDPLLDATTPLFTRTPSYAPVIQLSDLNAAAAKSLGVEFFEPVQQDLPDELRGLFEKHNRMPFYTWSSRECCLPEGATRATLEGHYPDLKPDMVLVFRELLGAESGTAQEADPARAHAVRLIHVKAKKADATPLVDPLTNDQITEIEWHAGDALPFPFCISAMTTSGYRDDLSVALGNIVLVDHGRTIAEWEKLPLVPTPNPQLAPVTAGGGGCAEEEELLPSVRFQPVLQEGPVTRAGRVRKRERRQGRETTELVAVDRSKGAGEALHWELRDVTPEIEVEDAAGIVWTSRRDLLASERFSTDFVVEAEEDGTSLLRFGDDEHGKRPDAGVLLEAKYRVGNGRRGNVGADSIAHIVFTQPLIGGKIVAVNNPLPARGGVDPEPLEDVRQKAPVAFRTQQRAVTPRDYEEVAQRHPEVQRAAVTFRWTGSWHTVFVTVDRVGGKSVDEPFEEELREFIETYRMAGYDLEIDGPRPAALELELHICATRDAFRTDVLAAVRDRFSSRNGGFFDPDRFTFGQPVYLSAIYAAAHEVPGVESVTIEKFQRLGLDSTEAETSGRISVGRLEIARLDNDPNFPENGVMTIHVDGGR
ncbi:MAG TPA: putative baseplate assembly protein [Thermoanaerobaculia bacterium]|nr:putative baseplate assembly protein [Thermoanaerobaculia bacterium]